jgi:hypothetical protein
MAEPALEKLPKAIEEPLVPPALRNLPLAAVELSEKLALALVKIALLAVELSKKRTSQQQEQLKVALPALEFP